MTGKRRQPAVVQRAGLLPAVCTVLHGRLEHHNETPKIVWYCLSADTGCRYVYYSLVISGLPACWHPHSPAPVDGAGRGLPPLLAVTLLSLIVFLLR